MNWYHYTKGVGVSRLQEYQVAFYDERSGKCYDESYYQPSEVECVMPYLLEPFCKVFAVFGKDEVYEITAERVK